MATLGGAPQALATLEALSPARPAVGGQVWMAFELGGYMFAPNLSKHLRMEVQPRCRARQFCNMPENTQGAMHRGATFHWNIYTRVETAGRKIDEDEAAPTTRFQVQQGSVTVEEYMNSVPFSEKLDNLSEQPVKDIINQVLAIDCAEVLDSSAYAQFEATPLTVMPAGAGFDSATDVQFTTNGTAPGINDSELRHEHVKKIGDEMRERNIPGFRHGDYYAMGRPSAFTAVRDDLESIQQYTDTGYTMIRDGEKGRDAGFRFIEQTNVASKGWTNGSDQVLFFGDDAVAECAVLMEEIRGKIPTGYGREQGIAWYYLGDFKIVRTKAEDARIIKWTSTS